MKRINILHALGLLAAVGIAPSYATVSITSMTPSVASPQPLGTTVTWTVKATDTGAGPLTFQFNVAYGTGSFTLVRDFNKGTLSSGVWTSQSFPWTTIAAEGTYTVQVIAKDFTTGESATKTATYQLASRVTQGQPAIHRTSNPIVALFSAPACATGSSMRVAFYTGANAPNYTAWATCNGTTSMNFYVAGMLPTTAYSMYSQTQTGGKLTNGSPLTVTTGSLPTRVPGGFFPTFTVNTPAPPNDPNPMLLWSFTKVIIPVATDLSGNVTWYYGNGSGTLLTRPLAGGTMLTIQNGSSWNSTNTVQQILREIDLAGNIVHETNTGIVSNQLVAMGVKDAAPCGSIKLPAQVGDACLNDFHHDAIRYTINGQNYTAFMAHVEKLFAPGTQGSTTGKNVDILSEMVIVLNAQWQVVWSYSTFDELPIARTAPLGETCTAGSSDCPTNLFLGATANDWTHANTVDYVAAPSTMNTDSGNLLLSIRDQDLVVSIKYKNGTGSCAPSAPNCLAWSMGPSDNLACPTQLCYTLDNTTGDPWPWFSHQHDVTYASNGAKLTINGKSGPLLTVFDNGNTRYSAAPLGLGSSCAPNDCNSRGQAFIVDQTNAKLEPVLIQDLGVRTTALGSAQVLSTGSYAFQTGLPTTQAIEIAPLSGHTTGNVVLNVGSVDYSYRGWQMPNLYTPPVL